MKHAVEEGQPYANAKQYVGDIEYPGKDFSLGSRPIPAGQCIDHVSHIAKLKTVIKISQHTGQKNAQ